MEEKVNKLPLRPIFYGMDPGDEVVYPRIQYSSVTSTASMLKKELDRLYKVTFDDREKNVHVKRVR